MSEKYSSRNNIMHLASSVCLGGIAIAWETTAAHQHGLHLQPGQITKSSTIQQCKSFELSNTDVTKVSNFVICTLKPPSPQQPTIVQVLEILQVTTSMDRCVYFLLQVYVISGFVKPYRYPGIRPKHPGTIVLVNAKVIFPKQKLICEASQISQIYSCSMSRPL